MFEWVYHLAILFVVIGLLMLIIGINYLCFNKIKEDWGMRWDEVYLAIMMILVLDGSAIIILFAV